MADQNFMAYLQGRGQSFNAYGAGAKQYPGGAPNTGPTDKPEAYDERDRLAKLRRNALLRRIQQGQAGNYMNKDYLRPQGGNW
jgi:hypothetical protein